MVESDIELLSGTAADIFVAGNRFTRFVDFISKYNVSIRAALEVSYEKHRLSMASSEANMEEQKDEGNVEKLKKMWECRRKTVN